MIAWALAGSGGALGASELEAADDAVVKIEATGVCGSDLHIYHGRVQIDPGFTIGHEFVGTVLAAGDQVTSVSEGDRVLGCFHTACATCAAQRHQEALVGFRGYCRVRTSAQILAELKRPAGAEAVA